jgi:cytochrome c oxidase subunit 3
MGEPGSNGVPDRLARASNQQTSSCGMQILILSLSVLFFASLVAYLFIYFVSHKGAAPEFPQLPGGLWVSTVLLLASSGTLHYALMAARRDNKPAIKGAMTATLALGLAFLVSQMGNWRQLHGVMAEWVTAHSAQGYALRFYIIAFYFFTVLHAAHVLGGLIPMAGVTAASYRGFYTRTSHNGLRLLGMYWHFLDIVWLVLFAVLSITLK